MWLGGYLGEKGRRAALEPDVVFQEMESEQEQQIAEGKTSVITSVSPRNLEIFRNGSVLPVDFAHVRPGMRLSVLKAAFPEGQVQGIHFIVKPRRGPFSQLTCGLGATGVKEIDPVVGYFNFAISSESSYRRVKDELLVALADYEVTPAVLGEVLHWQEIEGLEASLSRQFYTVTH